MKSEVVFLLEEKSMEELLKVLLPRLAPELQFRLIPHEGKGDLEKSIPRKLKAWKSPARFVIVRDQDTANCKDVKLKLDALIPPHQKAATTIRIACRELESWILGDLDALGRAFNELRLSQVASKEKFRNPDALRNPSEEVTKLIPTYQKRSGARRVAEHMTPERNVSRSFQVFERSVKALAETAVEFPR